MTTLSKKITSSKTSAFIAEQLVGASSTTEELVQKCEWEVAASRHVQRNGDTIYRFMDGSHIKITEDAHSWGLDQQGA